MHYSNYDGKTLAQVRNLLIRQGMQPAERHELLDQLKAYRTKVKSQNAQARHYRKVWRDFADPLMKEIQKVRVAMYYKGSPRRNIALLQYRELLDELLNLFKGFAEGKRSPTEIAQRNRIPNDGAHWTDWIPEDEKERINADFALSREKGRKMYQPFPRNDEREDKTAKESGV